MGRLIFLVIVVGEVHTTVVGTKYAVGVLGIKPHVMVCRRPATKGLNWYQMIFRHLPIS